MGSVLLSSGDKINPRIEYIEENNNISISGWSFCEKPIEVYQPVFDIVQGIVANNNEKISLNFNLSCYNTASSKTIVELVDFLSKLSKKFQTTYHINWMYESEDDEAREWGEDLMMASGVDFNFITQN